MTLADDDGWASGWDALLMFVRARGSARVPPRAVAGGVPVGAWVAARREEYWAAVLAPERAASLAGLPDWEWGGAAQKRWETRLQALARYVEAHGAANVELHVTVGKIGVGAWVQGQRDGYAAGTLPAPLAARLESLPGWEWTTVRDRWERGLHAAKAFVADNETLARLDDDTEVDGVALGHWIRRCQEDHAAGTLSAAQIDALHELPGWRPAFSDEHWERGIIALRHYYVEHGAPTPPQKCVVDGFPLGMWVHNRRQQQRRGQLPAGRIAELDAMPGWRWAAARLPEG